MSCFPNCVAFLLTSYRQHRFDIIFPRLLLFIATACYCETEVWGYVHQIEQLSYCNKHFRQQCQLPGNVLNVFKAVSTAERLPIQAVIGATAWAKNHSLLTTFITREGKNYPAETFVEISEILKRRQTSLKRSLALFTFSPHLRDQQRFVEAVCNNMAKSISLLTTFAEDDTKPKGGPVELGVSEATCCSLRYEWARIFRDDSVSDDTILATYQGLPDPDKGRALCTIADLVAVDRHSPIHDHSCALRVHKVLYQHICYSADSMLIFCCRFSAPWYLSQ